LKYLWAIEVPGAPAVSTCVRTWYLWLCPSGASDPGIGDTEHLPQPYAACWGMCPALLCSSTRFYRLRRLAYKYII